MSDHFDPLTNVITPLEAWRRKNKISKEGLSRELGISLMHTYRILENKPEDMMLSTALLINKVTGVDLEDLILR